MRGFIINKLMKYLLILLVLFYFVSCSKEDTKQTDNIRKDIGEDIENPADTNLTPEEKFSASLMSDFLESSEDDDLADFIESEIYKTSRDYNGTAMVEVTPSTWLVCFEKEGAYKNYLLQKLVDNTSNEYYFSLKETSLSVSDVITRRSIKAPAGDQ